MTGAFGYMPEGGEYPASTVELHTGGSNYYLPADRNLVTDMGLYGVKVVTADWMPMDTAVWVSPAVYVPDLAPEGFLDGLHTESWASELYRYQLLASVSLVGDYGYAYSTKLADIHWEVGR